MLASRDDLASDFSVFHGIRDMGSMPARTFARLAQRIGAYGGAVTARAAGNAVPQPAAPPQVTARPRQMVPARPVTPRNAASLLPVATTAQLRATLGKVPGVDMWADVREVKPDDV